MLNGGSFSYKTWLSVLLLLLLLLFEAGCSTLAGKGDGRCGFWIDVYRGEPVPYEDILDDLANVRIIYLGERHTLERHHTIQRNILTDLAKRNVSLALALEQMESFQQPALDRYHRGEINYDQLAEVTEWSKRWRNFQQYRPVLEAARKSGAPILAMNARKETIRLIARKGIDKLTPQTRCQLPTDINLDDPSYEKFLNRIMMVMANVTPERLHKMFQAQIARDEKMAHVISSFLQTKQGRDRTIVVLCGTGHISYGLGIPARVRRKLPGIKDRIILLSASGDVELSPQEKTLAREITITHEQLRDLNKPIADYLHATNLKTGN